MRMLVAHYSPHLPKSMDAVPNFIQWQLAAIMHVIAFIEFTFLSVFEGLQLPVQMAIELSFETAIDFQVKLVFCLKACQMEVIVLCYTKKYYEKH